MRRERSGRLMARAQRLIPGGVNSPVRAFRAVGGQPVFVSRGAGAHTYDVDGNRYLDFVGSFGPLILGHAHPAVVEATVKALHEGTSFGASTPREVEMAEQICTLMPSIEQVRMVNSGTEATMSALRLARGATGRVKLIKFSGCYHGHADPFLAEAGSGVLTLGIPGSAGVPAATAADTLTVPYNDLQATADLMATVGEEVAAIIVEPIACNMGLVQPVPGFLAGLRALCDRFGALLIFDEVISGFRVALGGAQGLLGVRPDLTTLGKIIGGGLPVGAYGGRADLMAQVAPAGPVYQAGTLAGHPVAMAAGLATLEILAEPTFYSRLDAVAEHMRQGVSAALARHGHPARIDRAGSIFYLWCAPQAAHPPKNFADIERGDRTFYARLFSALLDGGVALAPSAFEVGFVSAAHTLAHVEATVGLFDEVLRQMPIPAPL